MKIVCFDLDDTLACTTHRSTGFNFDNATDDEWEEYFKKCEGDGIIYPSADIFSFYKEHPSYEVHIWSGRNAIALKETCAWLRYHGINPDVLRMRPVNCRKKNVDLKRDWANEVGFKNIHCVFDDNETICNMFVENGVVAYCVKKDTIY